MRPSIRTALAVAASFAALASPPADAQRMIGGNPGPAYNYVCPNADGGPPLDCYYDAVRHLEPRAGAGRVGGPQRVAVHGGDGEGGQGAGGAERSPSPSWS